MTRKKKYSASITNYAQFEELLKDAKMKGKEFQRALDKVNRFKLKMRVIKDA